MRRSCWLPIAAALASCDSGPQVEILSFAPPTEEAVSAPGTILLEVASGADGRLWAITAALGQPRTLVLWQGDAWVRQGIQGIPSELRSTLAGEVLLRVDDPKSLPNVGGSWALARADGIVSVLRIEDVMPDRIDSVDQDASGALHAFVATGQDRTVIVRTRIGGDAWMATGRPINGVSPSRTRVAPGPRLLGCGFVFGGPGFAVGDTLELRPGSGGFTSLASGDRNPCAFRGAVSGPAFVLGPGVDFCVVGERVDCWRRGASVPTRMDGSDQKSHVPPTNDPRGASIPTRADSSMAGEYVPASYLSWTLAIDSRSRLWRLGERSDGSGRDLHVLPLSSPPQAWQFVRKADDWASLHPLRNGDVLVLGAPEAYGRQRVLRWRPGAL